MSNSGLVSNVLKCPVSGLQVFVSQFWLLGKLTIVASLSAQKTKDKEIATIRRMRLSLSSAERLENTKETLKRKFQVSNSSACSFYSSRIRCKCMIDISCEDCTIKLKIHKMVRPLSCSNEKATP